MSNYTLLWAPPANATPEGAIAATVLSLIRPQRPPVRPRRVVLVAKGLNDQRFTGVLCTTDEPSTRPPHGAEGRRIVLPSRVAHATMAGLQGMPINLAADLGDHDQTRIVGVIDAVRLQGNQLQVQGRLYDKNMPREVAQLLTRNDLGMSFELSQVSLESTSADPWVLAGCTFTGASILRREAAAFSTSSLTLL
jgi:hypothetical protein